MTGSRGTPTAKNQVSAFALCVRSGERGTQAAPETSEALSEMAKNRRGGVE